MSAAVILQGILIYGLLAWKSFQLSRAGHDLPLRCVVAVFACAGAAYPVGVAYNLGGVPAGAWWLMAAQPSLLLGCICSLNLFFVFSLVPPARARRLAVIRAVVLVVLVALMAGAAATVTAYSGMSGPTERGTDVMYLVYNAGMGGFLADSWGWARRGIAQADRTGARALRLASWGIGLMVAGLIPLTADVAVRVFGVTMPVVLGRVGQLLVLPGILLFLVGIAYPTALDRVRVLRAWRRHRRTYRELGPLWHSLHSLFPEGSLPTRLPSSCWLEAVTPWHARRRAVRRQLECRDGLVRLSPCIRPPAGSGDLAERVLEALRTVDPGAMPTGKAVPVAIPQEQGTDADIIADAAELVRLSRAIEAARSAGVLPSAIERLCSGGKMKVLIAGGGIAGPAAAIALDKAGIASEIYEAYPAGASADAGAFLTITANGQDALDAIGAGDEVRSRSFPAQRLRLFDAGRVLLVDVPLGRDGRAASRTIGRAALSHALRAIAVRRQIPVLYGKRVVSASADPGGGVVVVFGDGSSARGDLLIGADGIHSPVRDLIDPAAPSPRYTGLVIACGYAPGHLETAAGYSMYYGSRAFFGCTNGPDDRRWWFGRIPADEATAARMAGSPHADLLARSYDGDGTPAAETIRASGRWPLTVTPARDIAHLPVWSRDRMIVIGDAAHPVSPMTTQGASLAIEDAAVLARCLRDVSPVPEALRVFERLRRERVEEIARSGARGENPAPPVPGPRTGPRPSTVLDHHIEWDEMVAIS